VGGFSRLELSPSRQDWPDVIGGVGGYFYLVWFSHSVYYYRNHEVGLPSRRDKSTSYVSKTSPIMKKHMLMVPIVAAALLATSCHVEMATAVNGLTGAWRGKVEIASGAYADAKDVKFMYVFNAGGTMTESSNYDASPPGSPAYGVWEKTGARQYEARYEFFVDKAPASFDEIAKGGGWAPDGHGVLTEKIALAADGNSFDSTIKYELFDRQGKPIDGGGDATCKGERIKF
jgi:hypothetical protein